MMKASITGWAIVDTRWGRTDLFYGVGSTRVHAITELLWNYFGETKVESKWPIGRRLRPRQKSEWNKLYREGYRCVKVRVSTLP